MPLLDRPTDRGAEEGNPVADLIKRDDALAALALVVKTNDLAYVPAYARKALKYIPAVDAVPVIRCKDCRYCRLLNDGISFECAAWDMDFYAPHYSAETYYCADGERRDR